MPKVFISCAGEDQQIALKLNNDLNRHNIKTYCYWIHSRHSNNLTNQMEQEIALCHNFLFIVSPNSNKKIREGNNVILTELDYAYKKANNYSPRQSDFIILTSIEKTQPIYEESKIAAMIDLYPSYTTGLHKIVAGIKNEEITKNSTAQFLLDEGKAIFQKKEYDKAFEILKQANELSQDSLNEQLAEEISLIYCISFLAGDSLYEVTLESMNFISDKLLALINSNHRKNRYTAKLVLGIIRYDYYKRKLLSYRGFDSTILFKELNNLRPPQEIKDLINHINFSVDASVKFNIK